MSTCACYIATLDYWKLPAHQQRWKQKNAAKLEENKQVFLQASWSHTMIQWWLEGDRAIFDCKTTEKKKNKHLGFISHSTYSTISEVGSWVHMDGFIWMFLSFYVNILNPRVLIYTLSNYAHTFWGGCVPSLAPRIIPETELLLATWYVFCAASTHDNWCYPPPCFEPKQHPGFQFMLFMLLASPSITKRDFAKKLSHYPWKKRKNLGYGVHPGWES